ncbi:MAG: hypothetical protein IJC64_01040 [Clostridia bacterium]|nr:hypothetical protein [Clostridia bacterium]
MLKKLLKYDLRATFKYWWIAAVSSLGLAVLCGIALNVLSMPETEENVFLTLFSILAIVLTVIGVSAFIVSAEIFIYVRFYQNFFSDEGYLTFTLPVKRHQLLNSKLISAILITASTLAVVAIDAAIVMLIHFGPEFFTGEFWGYIGNLFGVVIDGAFEELGAYAYIYLIEIIVILAASVLFSTLLVFTCITVAATITKKNKVFAAIGIYYLVNAAMSFISQLITTVGLVGISPTLEKISQQALMPLAALVLLVLGAIVVAACIAIYTLVHWLLDRKLNLA